MKDLLSNFLPVSLYEEQISRRNFLKLSASTAALAGLNPSLVFDTAPTTESNLSSGRLNLNGQDFKVLDAVIDSGSRHIVPPGSGFVYWTPINLLYAEWFQDGQLLQNFSSPDKIVNPRLKLQLEQTPQHPALNLEARYRRSLKISTLGEPGQAPVRVSQDDHSWIEAYQIELDSKRQPKTNSDGTIKILRPVITLNQTHLRQRLDEAGSPADSLYTMTCDNGQTTAVGFFTGTKEAGVNLNKVQRIFAYPYQYLTVEFSPVST